METIGHVLRGLRLSVTNLLGVTIPGLLVLSLVGLGMVAPMLHLAQHVLLAIRPTSTLAQLPLLPPLGTLSVWATFSLLLILAYVIGYVLRLVTPDELDEISAKHVIEGMGGEEGAKKDNWPCRGGKDDQFPYYYTYEYLKHRGHGEKADLLVTWGLPKGNRSPRSKTAVNTMKLEVAQSDPNLSSVIDSNEAHIRLLFGAWQVSRLAKWPLWIGIIASAAGVVATVLPVDRLNPTNFSSAHPIWLAISITLLTGGSWAKTKIEHLFHYRRVRELMDVIDCAYLIRKKSGQYAEVNTRGKHGGLTD